MRANRWKTIVARLTTLAMVIVGGAEALGQVSSHWLTATSGNWTDPTRWSTEPYFPNNNSPEGESYDVFVTATGSPYTISLGSTIAVNSLTIDSPDATVRQTSSLFSPGALSILQGTYRLEGGSVATSELTGSGTFMFGGGSSTKTLRGGALTIGPDITIRTTDGSGTVDFKTNYGTMMAETGRTLTVTGTNWQNFGTLMVTGGTLRLEGSTTTAGLGDIQHTGSGSLHLEGILNNVDATLALTGTTGSVTIGFNSRLIGGTVTGSDGAKLRTSGTPIIDNITVVGDVFAVQRSSTVTVLNGLTLDNATVNIGALGSGSGNGTLRFTGTQTLTGTGEIQLDRGFIGASGGTLTIDPNVVIRGMAFVDGIGETASVIINKGTLIGGSSQQFDIRGTTVENQGLIEYLSGFNTVTNLQNTGTLNVKSGTVMLRENWSGTDGTINLTGGTLDLGGTFAVQQLGTLNRTGGAVQISGTLNLAGSTLALDASTGTWMLAHGGRIKDGTISTSGGATLDFVTTFGTGSTLEGVTLASNLAVPAGAKVSVVGGLTLNNATLTMNAAGSNASELRFVGGQTLGGQGEVVVDGSSILTWQNGTLTVGPDITIRSTSGVTRIGDNTPNTLVNHGTIVAHGSLTMRAATVINHGSISTATGGFLTIGGLQNQGSVTASGTSFGLIDNWHNAGTITTTAGINTLGGTFTAQGIGNFSRTGGELRIAGRLDNTGNTLDIATTFNGPVDLFGEGAIVGGAILGSPAAPFGIRGGGTGRSLLDGVILQSDMIVRSGAVADIRGGLTVLPGRKVLFSEVGHLLIPQSQSIAGGGEVHFSAAAGSIEPHSGATLTIAPDITIRNTGTTASGTIGGGSTGSVVNEGLIWATAPSGQITLRGNFINNGVIRLDAGQLNLGGTDSMNNWGTVQRNGGSINFIGTLNNAGKVFDLSSTPVGPVNLATGATIIGGTITANGPDVPKFVPVSSFVHNAGSLNTPMLSNVTLATALDIEAVTIRILGALTLSGNPNIRLVGTSGGSSLQFFDPDPIAGEGTFSFEGTSPNHSISRSGTPGSRNLTIGPGITIRTVSNGGRIAGGPVINQGILSAAAPGKNLVIDGNFDNHGSVEARNGGTLLLLSFTIFNLSDDTLAGGSWKVHAGSTIDLGTGKTFTTNAADVTLDGPSSTFNAINPIHTNAGSWTITGGRWFSTSGSLLNSGTLRVGKDSRLTVNGTLTNTGKIKGKGEVVATTVISSGEISPGDSAGLLRILGNFVQTETGILDIEIGGYTPGVDFDLLEVAGDAVLNGTLRITLLGDFVPLPDDTFTFITAASLTGQFSQVLLPPLPTGVAWSSSGLASGQLSTVPEPTTLLLPLTMLMLTRRRRSRRA